MYLVPSGHIYFALPHEHGGLDLDGVDQVKTVWTEIVKSGD